MAATKAANIHTSNDGWDTVIEPYAPTFVFASIGDSIQGIYSSMREVEQEDMNNPGTTRMARVYEIVTDNGDKYSVWGGYAIDLGFEKIVPGQYVRITYSGSVPLKGGRSVRQFAVQVRNG